MAGDPFASTRQPRTGVSGGAQLQTAVVFFRDPAKHLREVFPGDASVLRLDDPEAKRRRNQVVDVADPRDAGDRVGDGAARRGEGVLDDLSCMGPGLLTRLEAAEACALDGARGPPEHAHRDQDGARRCRRSPRGIQPDPDDGMGHLADAKSREEAAPDPHEHKQPAAFAVCVGARRSSHAMGPRKRVGRASVAPRLGSAAAFVRAAMRSGRAPHLLSGLRLESSSQRSSSSCIASRRRACP